MMRSRTARDLEPDEAVRPEAQEIRPVGGNLREDRVADQLDRPPARILLEVELAGLHEAREVVHAEDAVVSVLADIGEDLAVLGPEELDRAAPEDGMALAEADEPLRP